MPFEQKLSVFNCILLNYFVSFHFAQSGEQQRWRSRVTFFRWMQGTYAVALL